jgi:Ca-activated chloride channel family protein
LAGESLEGSGSILWIADSIAGEETAALSAWRTSSRTPVILLPPLLPGVELDVLKKNARVVGADVVQLSADQSDISALIRAAKFSTAATSERSDRWQESGYWLAPVLAALLLPFFRKGWMTRTAARG